MNTVKELLIEVAKYEADKMPNVDGMVNIDGKSARVDYKFTFKIHTETLDLIKILNKENIHTVIMTGAENTMISYYNDQVIHAKSVYGAQYTEHEAQVSSQTWSIPSAVYHSTSSQTDTPEPSPPTFLGYGKPGTIFPVVYGKDEILQQIMEMRGSEPCIVFADSVPDYGLVHHMTRGVIVFVQNSEKEELYKLVIREHTAMEEHHVRVYKQLVHGSVN
ncbi:unnamed protein product [Albugo candida]|uniref:Uncharacterized protein n=1 Tax=Albugo candida TaxID=65357 RepID=A0A024FV85_9STRA|nr:unnamed protein product [Albugo candida]|eukprot:CCI10559.1 unnamed protein product [Albugo candida]